MKKLIPILFLITLSFNLFSQVEDDNLFNIFLGNKSLLEEKDLLMLYPNKSTKMFIGTNEKKYSFLDTVAWSYNKDFFIESKHLKNRNIYLYVHKIIGPAKFYLNDILVLETNNGFRTYEVNIHDLLKKGNNKLRVDYTPIYHSLNYNNNKYNTLASEKRVINRYPQYLFGWDWYPKMLYPSFEHLKIDSREKQNIEIEYNVQTLKIENDTAYMLLNIENDKHYFKIAKPRLWWPNGIGETYYYHMTTKDVGYNLIDAHLVFGVRTIELIQEKDSIGQSFYFKINGKPMFVKGANYIQQSITDTDEIRLAKKLGINMLRVWGGSDYGDGLLYNECDQLGILVWQDFPFACALYPADSSFLENVKEEAIQNVKRIANHPSLALWCGNNEIWEGWNNWGWKQEVKDTALAIENYNKLFNELLPNIVKEYTPTINYIHTSPLHGWGEKESLTHGDCHYWGVWWGDSIFETYTRKVPRFMSEYGFQSPPTLSTLEDYMSKPYSKENPEFAIHQKHPRGFELIDNRVKQWYGDYTTDEDYIFKAGATAQEAYKIAIEAHRRAMPYCMGTMFWQFNEPYPAIGWSCIDYKNNPKPIYYTIKKAYEPIIFSIDKYSNPDSIFIYICNDSYESSSLDYTIQIKDNNDKIKFSVTPNTISAEKFKSKIIYSIALKDIKDFNPKTDYLWVEGEIENNYEENKGKKTISNYTFFVYPKDYIDINKYNEVKRKYYK
ncbi:MAG: hypothetical protein SO179_02085 [Bacteroidales bacterium]|nr:hypothetical protein [Bacteroidales bacterium]